MFTIVLILHQSTPKELPTDSTERITHIFISGEVGRNQVCMEAREAQDGPDWEETYHQLHCSERLSQGEYPYFGGGDK